MLVQLPVVANTKKLDRKYVDHVASILRPVLEEKFDGNHTAMAKALKVSQPQLSSVLKRGGGERGAGIVFLLAVREYLGDKTLDELLGLDPPEFVRLSVVESHIDRMLDKRESARKAPGVPLLPAATLARGRAWHLKRHAQHEGKIVGIVRRDRDHRGCRAVENGRDVATLAASCRLQNATQTFRTPCGVCRG